MVAMAISKNFVIFAYRISLIFHRIDPGPGTGFEHFRSILTRHMKLRSHFVPDVGCRGDLVEVLLSMEQAAQA